MKSAKKPQSELITLVSILEVSFQDKSKNHFLLQQRPDTGILIV